MTAQIIDGKAFALALRERIAGEVDRFRTAARRKPGLAVVLVSSDMPELIGLSHRVYVLRGGGIAGELSRRELDADDAQEKLFRYASGQEATVTA